MSSMKDLLEKMDDNYPFAGEKAKPKQKPGDQVRGKDAFKIEPRTVPCQKHPAQGELVGAAEESVEHIADQLRKELEEYGAPGSGISSGTDMDRTQVRQMRRDQKAQKQQVDAQEDNIEGQIKQLKAQMLAIKKSPQPVPVPGDGERRGAVHAGARQPEERVHVHGECLRLQERGDVPEYRRVRDHHGGCVVVQQGEEQGKGGGCRVQ